MDSQAATMQHPSKLLKHACMEMRSTSTPTSLLCLLTMRHPGLIRKVSRHKSASCREKCFSVVVVSRSGPVHQQVFNITVEQADVDNSQANVKPAQRCEISLTYRLTLRCLRFTAWSCGCLLSADKPGHAALALTHHLHLATSLPPQQECSL